LRTVFLGTSDFAAAVLERLAASDHRPARIDPAAGAGGSPPHRSPSELTRWGSRWRSPSA